jgi:hypothetical protein
LGGKFAPMILLAIAICVTVGGSESRGAAKSKKTTKHEEGEGRKGRRGQISKQQKRYNILS